MSVCVYMCVSEQVKPPSTSQFRTKASITLSVQASPSLSPDLSYNTATCSEIKRFEPRSYFSSGYHFKVCVTILAGPTARPDQPRHLTLTASTSVKWKEEESKLFVPWALTAGSSTPVLAKDKSNGICSGEAAYVARCCWWVIGVNRRL